MSVDDWVDVQTTYRSAPGDDWVDVQTGAQPVPSSSTIGTAARGLARGVLPAAGSWAGMAAGAKLGAVLGAMVPGAGETGISEAVGAIGGGLAGAFVGGDAMARAQEKILELIPPSVREAIGQSKSQQEADELVHPYIKMAAELAPNLALMRPGAAGTAVREGATALERVMAHPAGARAVGAGFMGAQEAGTEEANTGTIDSARVVIAAGAGALMNKETGLGRSLRAGSEAVVPFGRKSPEAVAGKVMEAGTVDDAIAAAKKASGVEPAATPEPLAQPEPSPVASPREAAPQARKALSFDDLADEVRAVIADQPSADGEALAREFPKVTEPVSVRPAEPQPGMPLPTDGGVTEPSTPIDQGIFHTYNNLAARHDTYLRWVNELTERRDNDPRIKAASAEIDAIRAKVKGNEQYLTQKQASRIADLQGYISDFRSVDTPDMARVKNVLAENYNAMLAMGPEVKAARQAARDQAARIYGDKANVISADELWQAGVKDADTPEIAEQKLSDFRLSPSADKLASEHGVEIASDAQQLPSSEYAELRRHGYEPIESAGARVEELAGIPKAAQESGTVPEVSSASNGLGRAPAAPRELPIADYPEELTAKAPEGITRPAPVEPTVAIEARAPHLTPAVLYEGKVHLGDTHISAGKDLPSGVITDEKNLAYVDDRGKVLSRSDALEYAKNFDLVQDKYKPYLGNYTGGLIADWLKPEAVRVAEKSQPQATRPRPLTSISGTGDVKPRGLSEGIEATAIEKKLTDTFGDLPEYRQVSMADQAVRAQRLVDIDFDTAKAVAMGQKAPPRGTLPESVLVAVERKALEDGDVETIRQLATQSRLTTEATTMGQRIRTLGERDKASPVAAIQAVQDARAEAMNARKIEPQKAVSNEVRVMKKEVRGRVSRERMAAFISEVTCGY